MNGIPQHDIPFPLMSQRPGHDYLTPYKTLYGAGVRLLQVDSTCSEDIYHTDIRAWIEPNIFDYSAQEDYWSKLISTCPEAQLCLRLYVASPPWWDRLHPEELQTYFGGRVEHCLQRTKRKTVPSLASEAWRKDACHSLQKFLTWLNRTNWSERIWGIIICYGITWEWGILGSDDFLDYSDPMLKHFRRWLQKSYTTDEALVRSWGDVRITFDTAEIPTPEERVLANGEFRIFPRDRKAYDFQRCLSDTNAEYLLSLARTVKESSGQKYKIGAFYGFTLTAREHNEFTGRYGAGGLQGGHHSLGKVLSSGILDFIASPYAYINRDLDDGLLVQHYPLSSVQYHGVHAYDENDLWTFSNPPKGADNVQGNISVGYSNTCYESIQHQRLALARALCYGTSYWWSELTDWIGPYALNFSDPSIQGELKRHVECFNGANDETNRPGYSRSVAQIALVVDEDAISALGLNSKLFLNEVYRQLPAWAWCGSPFDVWLASDVNSESMKAYRLVYVFAPYLEHARRTLLKSALCNEDRTIWWGPYSGWLTEQGTDDWAFHDLTDFDCVDIPKGQLKRMSADGWTSIYGCCAGMSSVEIQKVIQAAGIHIYGQAPIHIMSSGDFLCVHVSKPGNYELDLPDGKWGSVFSGDIIPNNRLKLSFEEKEVMLFKRV